MNPMNRKDRSYEPEYATRNRAAIKTISMQVAVMEPDLEKAIREAFNLAKSAGRELNLAFTPRSIPHSIPKQLGIGVAQLELP